MHKPFLAVIVLLFASDVAAQWKTGRVFHTGPNAYGVGGNELTVVPHYATGQPKETYSNPCSGWAECIAAGPGSPYPYGKKIFNKTYTWVDAEVFEYPNGDLGFVAGGNNKSTSQSDLADGVADHCGSFRPAGIDLMYTARRSSTGAWTTPKFRDCPLFPGQPRFCNKPPDYPNGPGYIDPTGGRSVVRIPHTGSPSGYRYFMAFNGGNADYVNGAIYWAMSDDAINWNIYNWSPPPNYAIRPIIMHGYPNKSRCRTGGAVEPSLLYDAADTQGGSNPNGTFYLYFTYIHEIGHSPEVFVYRFGYNPAHTYGFGGNNQLFFDPEGAPGLAFYAHSGNLVFENLDDSIDAGYGDPEPAIGADAKIRFSWHGEAGMTSISLDSENGFNGPGLGVPGDIKRSPQTGQYVKITSKINAQDQYQIQTNSILTDNTWSAPATVTTASLHGPGMYPTTCSSGGGAPGPVIYPPGLWYGTFSHPTYGNRTGWWMWATVHAARNPTTNALESAQTCFSGTAIVVAALCAPGESTANYCAGF